MIFPTWLIRKVTDGKSDIVIFLSNTNQFSRFCGALIQIYFLLISCNFKESHWGIISLQMVFGQSPKWNKAASHTKVWANRTSGWGNSKCQGPALRKNCCLWSIPISPASLKSNEWERKNGRRKSQRHR